MTQHEVVLLLETHAELGLTDLEAQRRLLAFGRNRIPAAGRPGTAARLLRQVRNPLIYVLLASVAIAFALREFANAAVILGVVVLNAAIGFAQESKAESALESLRAMVLTRARVRREGRMLTVDSTMLVPGDVVLLDSGDKVPADMRLLDVSNLRVDESALTGESMPVAKDEIVVAAETMVADRRNMVYSGTLVTGGSGTGVVVETGAGTELGEVHRLVGSADELATPLTRKLARFSGALTVAILGLAAGTFAIGLARGEPAADMFIAAIALAVGAIPEGLPAAVTIMMAIGVRRMARRRAIIRRLPAVETLGSTTVICTDKTGTLTENQMTVRRVWTQAATYEVTGSGYEPTGSVVDLGGAPVDPGDDKGLAACLMVGALCNDAGLVRGADGRWRAVGDPTEAAMLTLASKAGLDVAEAAREHPRVDVIPFSSELNFMVAVTADRARPLRESYDGRTDLRIWLKGATEAVLPLCDSCVGADGATRTLVSDEVLGQSERLAADGLRVLAAAVGYVPRDDAAGEDGRTSPDELGGLAFAGLIAMLDPPRPGAAEAVESCRTAGIDVKLVTGDHPSTAWAVARQVGVVVETSPTSEPGSRRIVTGADIDALDRPELVGAACGASVFARVTPEQKLRLVRAIQQGGHVVAMTGDGVNDAPALRQADIGVAMGLAGTDVAKEAADMVLTDDDFATIEAAVEEGRGVFANLVKFIAWTLPTNVAEGLVILVAIIVGTTLPILPLQILWINMTTAVALGLMLAFEPNEPDVMRRPPRDPGRPLLTGTLMSRVVLVSGLLVGASWWLFEWEISSGASVAEARTAALNLFVAVEAVYLIGCRSLSRPIWKLGVLSNRWVVVGIGLQAVGQLAITYVPALNQVFSTVPLPGEAWARIGGLAAGVAVALAIDKGVRLRVGRMPGRAQGALT